MAFQSFSRLKLLVLSSINKGNVRSVKAKKHILYSFFLKVVQILIGLLYIPLLIDYLDNERYGIWLTISSLLMWLNFFDIGLGNGMRNKLTEAIAKNKMGLARKYISTTYALLSLIFIAILVLFYIINPFLNWSHILNATSVPKKELGILVGIVFTIIAFKFVFQLVGKVYLAFQRPAMNNLFTPLGNIVGLITVLCLLYLSETRSLLFIGTVITISPFLVLVFFNFFAFNNEYKHLKPSLRYIDFSYTKELLGLGVKIFIIQLFPVIIFTSSNLIITQVFNPVEVTRYNIVYKYFQIPFMVYAIVITPIWSAVTDAYFKSDLTWLKKTLKKLNIISIVFSIGVIIMIIFGQWAIKLLIADRIDISNDIIITMGLYVILKIISSPYNAFINGIGKLKVSNYLISLSLILFYPLAIYLSKSLSNSTGVILSTSIINVIIMAFLFIQTYKIITGKDRGIWSK